MPRHHANTDLTHLNTSFFRTSKSRSSTSECQSHLTNMVMFHILVMAGRLIFYYHLQVIVINGHKYMCCCAPAGPHSFAHNLLNIGLCFTTCSSPCSQSTENSPDCYFHSVYQTQRKYIILLTSSKKKTKSISTGAWETPHAESSTKSRYIGFKHPCMKRSCCQEGI